MKKRFLIASLCASLCVLPMFVHAASPYEQLLEMRPNTVLEQWNPDETVIRRGEALRLLLAYFDVELLPIVQDEQGKPVRMIADVWPAHAYFQEVQTACTMKLLDCTDASRRFRGNTPMTLESFLKLYFDLVYQKDPNYLQYKYAQVAEEWYYPYIMEAKRQGLIGQERPLGTMTHSDVMYLLYKDAMLASYHHLLPRYFVGLVPVDSWMTPEMYHDTAQLEDIEKEYRVAEVYIAQQEERLLAAGFPVEMLEEVKERLGQLRTTVGYVRAEILANPLYYHPDFASIRSQIKEFGLREIIGEGYYDFSKDPGYRKNNVRVSLDKFNGIIIQPGEEFNYWDELYKKGTDGIQNGWLIVGDKEVWGWGGGLCGTATALFRAAWNSGMDIAERRAHTIYYTNLYAREDVGLDAAVYQNSPNFRFANPTEGPVMIHVVYNDRKDIARVLLLGTKHFANVEFPALRKEGRTYVRSRVITYPDGTKREDVARSTYKNL